MHYQISDQNIYTCLSFHAFHQCERNLKEQSLKHLLSFYKYFSYTPERFSKKIEFEMFCKHPCQIREHQQKFFVMLSGFWPLRWWALGCVGRGGGVEWIVNLLKRTTIFLLSGIVEWSSKNLQNVVPPDVKANKNNKK